MINLKLGDNLKLLKEMEDNSVDSIVTDPPYGLSFMGKKWDYEVPSVELWEECFRVLKPGGHLLAFAGTRTQHRMAVNIEDAGFEIRDMIAWIYGSGFPKSHNIGKAIDKIQGNEREVIGIDENFLKRNPNKLHYEESINNGFKDGIEASVRTKGHSEWEGWGTALKPALEPITVARKPISEKTIAENVLKWGTGGINIDECRVGTKAKSFKDKRVIKTNDVYGKYNPSDYDGTQGRFPANLIHDGSDEVLELFPDTKATQTKGTDNRQNKGNSMFIDGVRNEKNSYNDSGSAARFFYCSKASKNERNAGLEGFEKKQASHDGRCKYIENPYQRHSNIQQNSHPTVKPVALMGYLVKLVTPENAIVLDPFMGSGSTAIACKNLNRSFIGMELDEEYFNIAKARIENMIHIKR